METRLPWGCSRPLRPFVIKEELDLVEAMGWKKGGFQNKGSRKSYLRSLRKMHKDSLRHWEKLTPSQRVAMAEHWIGRPLLVH